MNDHNRLNFIPQCFSFPPQTHRVPSQKIHKMQQLFRPLLNTQKQCLFTAFQCFQPIRNSSKLDFTMTRNFYPKHPYMFPRRYMSRFTPEEEQQHRELERWGNNFQLSHIQRSFLDFSFARSSGPGGQNVNKVSSKAQVKFKLDDADWIHPLVRQKIKANHARYLSTSDEFTIQSEVCSLHPFISTLVTIPPSVHPFSFGSTLI